MPIRFRCAYCNQLMAIARRKAGTVVRCPTCAGQVVVPSTDTALPAGPAKEPKQGGGAFERSDFDQLFQNAPAPPPPTQQPGFALGPEPAPPGPGPGFDVARAPIMTPTLPGAGRRPRGLVLTPAKLVLLFLVVVALLGLAFLVGFLVGQAT